MYCKIYEILHPDDEATLSEDMIIEDTGFVGSIADYVDQLKPEDAAEQIEWFAGEGLREQWLRGDAETGYEIVPRPWLDHICTRVDRRIMDAAKTVNQDVQTIDEAASAIAEEIRKRSASATLLCAVKRIGNAVSDKYGTYVYDEGWGCLQQMDEYMLDIANGDYNPGRIRFGNVLSYHW